MTQALYLLGGGLRYRRHLQNALAKPAGVVYASSKRETKPAETPGKKKDEAETNDAKTRRSETKTTKQNEKRTKKSEKRERRAETKSGDKTDQTERGDKTDQAKSGDKTDQTKKNERTFSFCSRFFGTS